MELRIRDLFDLGSWIRDLLTLDPGFGIFSTLDPGFGMKIFGSRFGSSTLLKES
jgi:hypothetical protein